MRLDRIFANKSWKEGFPNMIAHHISMAASDHCLLVLGLKSSKPHRKTSKHSSLKRCGQEKQGVRKKLN